MTWVKRRRFAAAPTRGHADTPCAGTRRRKHAARDARAARRAVIVLPRQFRPDRIDLHQWSRPVAA
ncbi:hypothetical protein WS86_28780 [Burkholderia savannae]|uniref:Uncharacterized protein n=1 Tax=Burkholderia savannae TaxID=1637837 RepID=A0ABR5T5X8_9BURK|nr:hypothetical protein WS86_28780 [Burkholderia savannae]KWZ37534.1 hypothetical protein WS72_21430 [Burkholderia savannae]KWZ48436.1 hypothetical protein WS73_08070 [Burkholderia savannae]